MAKQNQPSAARGNRPTGKRTSNRPGRQRGAQRESTSSMRWGIALGKINYIGILAGIGVIIIGYLLMATGIADDPANNDGIWNNTQAVTIAPILLAIGYCVIIPIAIFYRPKQEAAEQEGETSLEQ